MLTAMIGRPRLIGPLNARRGFVAILAAPGAGKTALVRQWDAADKRPFEWVGPISDAAEVQRLRARLSDSRDPFVLVLDDIHRHPDAGGSLIASLADLDLAPGVAVVVSGRELRARALTRLRLRPELVEISDEDLALDEESAARLLGDAAGPDDVRRIVHETRGWVTGIHLARSAITNGRAQAERFSGSDRFVREYISSEVLDELEPDLVDFMLRSALFEELTAPFCDAVLGTDDAQRRLELLEARHLFLSAPDRDGLRFRWHPLVRESLVAELERRSPGLATPLRVAGADWLAAHQSPRAAISLRLAAGDRTEARQLLADVVLPMFYGGHLDQIVEIIHGIGPDLAVADGYLATMFAYTGVMTGDAVCARRWARAAADFYRTQAFANVDEEVAFLTLRAHLCTDGVSRMRADAEAARMLVAESSAWRAPALMLCGIAAGLAGDAAAALATLDEAIHVSHEIAALPALVLALAEKGEFGRATDREVDQAIEAVEHTAYARYPHAALAPALRAEVLARGGKSERARAAVEAAHAYRPVVGGEIPWLAAQVRLHIARALASLGDVAGARIVLAEADDILAPLPDTGVLGTHAKALAQALRPLRAEAPTGAALLSTAELRLLPLLPSHLSFVEIGDRLHLSRNTIKTHAASVYRKLGVSSRSEAVEHAVRLGLVEV